MLKKFKSPFYDLADFDIDDIDGSNKVKFSPIKVLVTGE